TRGVQRQFEDAIGGVVTHHAVGGGRVEAAMIFAAGAHDDLGEAGRGVGGAGRILRRKALVVVIVAVEHQVGVGVVQVLPEVVYGGIAQAGACGEQRAVPVGQRAHVG